MNSKEIFINICNITTNVLGLHKGSLAHKSRDSDLQVGRSVASVIARIEENIKHSVIAEVINRHRASIYHYEKSHQNYYSEWEKYRNAFNKVYIAYKKMEDSKNIFINSKYMKHFLLKNGVKETLKNEVEIEITSGKVSVIIKTSFMDFSNQIEIIKFVLRNYNYTTKVTTE